MKVCNKCGESKPLSEFNKNKSCKDGVANPCKACKSKLYKEYKRPVRKIDPVKRRDYSLRHYYNISLEEYDLLLAYQGGKCYMCGKPCASGKNLSVDHDHASGAVRGLLCFKCNKFVVGSQTLETARKIVAYFEDPPADRVFGMVRLVPEARKVRKRGRKRTAKRKNLGVLRRN